MSKAPKVAPVSSAVPPNPMEDILNHHISEATASGNHEAADYFRKQLAAFSSAKVAHSAPVPQAPPLHIPKAK